MEKKTKETENKIDFDFRTIKSFEDACAKLGIDTQLQPILNALPEEFKKPIIAVYKLMIIFKAINDGWIPDWSDSNQYKYYPWFWVLSSGLGFRVSYYICTLASTCVGSRLCTDTSEKAMYIAEQFESEYKDFLLLAE
jgi:hypothetical protein